MSSIITATINEATNNIKATVDEKFAGPIGPTGKSAYDIAVLNGFAGTEAEWLASLQGPPGPAPTGDYVPLTRKVNEKELSSDISIDKSDVGLGNANNTSDADKPISSAQQEALDLKAPLASPTFTGTVSGITKSMVGLGNVDNTSDANKPISSDAQAALDNKADLVGGLVPANQLPGYVDDVLEFANMASFPITGDAGKIYVALDANKTYRWSGSAYVEIGGGGVALGETSSTAYRGDRGKIAYDHSQDTATNPHNVTKSQVGLGSVDNTADTAKPVSTAQQTALDLKADKYVSFNTQTASYTLVLTDAGKTVEINNASANNLTVPLNSSVAFPVGTQIVIHQYGAGQTTIVPTGGVTIRNAYSTFKIAAQYALATLQKRGTDEWLLVGDLVV